jgi:acyl-CoA reductase-like NAD-dependent aldehyde dehydrogenase
MRPRSKPSCQLGRASSSIATAGSSDILRKLAALLEDKVEHFAKLIAAEGGKPYTDAKIEATRALDGVRNAVGELRNLGGKEIPMGLTAASAGRLAFTFREPIGVVAAISASTTR